jgi:type II secretory pathway predicted ATPase ExeA
MTVLLGPGGQSGSELVELVGSHPAAREQRLVDRAIRRVVEQDAVRFLAVASAAARLLDVLLERGRRLVVDDVADVGLVDSESERVGGNHHRTVS